MNIRVKDHLGRGDSPTWRDAEPGMVFSWHGSDRLVVNPMDAPLNRVYTLNLDSGAVTWAWSKTEEGLSLKPVFLGYADELRVTQHRRAS